MKYTNKFKLPEFVANALMHSDYEKVGDFSATGLIKNPRQRILADRHGDKIVMDVSENTYSLLGTAVHKALEIRGSAEDVIAEKRMVVPVQVPGHGELTISGQPDLVDVKNKTLWDYKCTSVWAFMLGGKPEWEKQLNIYRWMLHLNGIQIDAINVVAIYRDWRRSDYENAYKKNPFSCEYPECNIGIISIPLVPVEAVEANVIKLLQRHKDQEKLSDGQLMLCSDDDRWARDACWAVKKKGGKRALSGGLHETEKAAIAFAGKQDFPTEIERRTGKSTKCESYCSAAPFCNQWKAIRDAQEKEREANS